MGSLAERWSGGLTFAPAAPWTIAAPTLEVQAGERSEDWFRRVHEHLAALETPA